MKVTADTNLLVRIVVRDDQAQARAAFDILNKAELVAIPLPSLCELAWVLESIYDYSSMQIAHAVRAIAETPNVVVDATAVEAGLRVENAGGDFADGVIAQAGAAMGGEVFVSFDRRAVSRVADLGLRATHPTALQ